MEIKKKIQNSDRIFKHKLMEVGETYATISRIITCHRSLTTQLAGCQYDDLMIGDNTTVRAGGESINPTNQTRLL